MAATSAMSACMTTDSTRQHLLAIAAARAQAASRQSLGTRSSTKLALKLSGAVQAARWTELAPDLGYVYSFTARHSLFSDTIRSMRGCLEPPTGPFLMGENRPNLPLARCSNTPKPPPLPAFISPRPRRYVSAARGA